MRQVTSSDTRTINGKQFRVDRLARLEYNGEWVEGGYDVIDEQGAREYFVSYPCDSDIKKRFDK